MSAVWDWLREHFEPGPQELVYLALAAWGVLRLAAATVETGQQGLFFSFGRARKVLGPGVRLLVPGLQKVRVVPVRARTLALPRQKVRSLDGLVWDVDAVLVWRVTDVAKALIEVDDLLKAMRQALGIGVQETLRGLDRAALRRGPELDGALARRLERRLEPWGVAVERAGFLSITPSDESLRVTQLRPRTRERGAAAALLAAGGLGADGALALLGPRGRHVSRGRALRRTEAWRRRQRRLSAALLRGGLGPARAQATRRALARGDVPPERGTAARQA